MPRTLLRHAFAVLLFLAVSASVLSASTISFTGNLRTDATVTDCGPGCTLVTDGDYAQFAAAVYTFNVASASTMQAISFSYGGGTNGNGTVIAAGGLEPYLSLFDSAGDFLASTYGGICPPTAKTYAGNCYDVLLNGGVLAAGNYQIALSAYANLSYVENHGTGTLADGFTGLGNLASGEDLHYAFDVDLTPATPPPTPVPEPASGALVGLALLGLRVVRTRLQSGRQHT